MDDRSLFRGGPGTVVLDLPHPNGQPETPRKKGDLTRFLKRLNREHDLDLPWNEEESPNKRRKSPGRDAVDALGFLFYQDSRRLESVLDDLRLWRSTLGNEESKVSFLLEKLTIAKTDCRKAKARIPERSAGRRRSLHEIQSHIERTSGVDGLEPSSPTLSVRHAPPPTFEMPADDFLPPPARRWQSLKRSRSGQSLTEKMRAASSREQQAPWSSLANSNGAMLPPLAHKSGETSVNTSFTTSAATSFNDSFHFSQALQRTQSPASPATTTADDDGDGDAATRYFTPKEGQPSLLSDGANEVDGGAANDWHRMRASQVTDYGSSPVLEGFGSQGLKDGSLTLLGENSRRGQTEDYRHSSQSQYGPWIDNSQLARLDDQIPRPEKQKVKEHLPTLPDKESPPGLHELDGRARVQHIFSDGLSSLVLPQSFLALPLEVRWEAMRVLQTTKLTARELEGAWLNPRTIGSLHCLTREKGIKYERGRKTDFSEDGLAARLQWSSRSRGRVFDLELCPPRRDRSNAFERKFGRDRFLVIDVPPLSRPPKDAKLDQFGLMVMDQVKEIFKWELHLAGRVWRQFLVQPKKSRKPGKTNTKGSVQVIFFAVRSEEGEANALKAVSIASVLDWAVQFEMNGGSSQCKMYSRLDLAASRTIPTIVFDASEIVWDADDKMPTDHPENIGFDDEDLPPNTTKAGEPMNDGCSRISTYAMREIQRILGLKHLPTVVQGRIMGAKGIWYRDDEDADLDEKPEKLIWISKSQIKVRQKPQSFQDQNKLTLNIVRTNGPPDSSFMYADFLPILTDRKVPQSVIERVVKESAKAIADEFDNALKDRMALAEWINRQRIVRSSRNQCSNIEGIGGFPVSREEQILQMLESGFEPTSCRYLADETIRTFQGHLDWIRSTFKTAIRSSTMLIGIADPFDILNPGEIHVGFSTPFEDGKHTRYNLRNLQALVSRLPSLGAPDMQRVRCVFKEELSHLHDVVVFPSRGPRSLASKLQGGDYDGDQFVIIWDQSLVKHFRNAPVPLAEDEPDHFGIETDKVKMGEMVQEYFSGGFHEQQVLDWISRNTDKRMQPDPLGQITLLYEKVVYHDNSLNTHRARQILRLHDLMIDAAKQGYTLSAKAWDAFKKQHKLREMDCLPDPANRVFGRGHKGLAQKTKSVAARKTHNISDYVYFEVVEPALTAAMKRAESITANAKASDDDIERVFYRMLESQKKRSVPHTEIHKLQMQLADLKKHWTASTNQYFDDPEYTDWRTVVAELRAKFEAILPEDASSYIVQCWLYRTGRDPTTWEKLRASCLVLAGASAKLMFCAAGYELCFLKAFASGSARPLRMDSYCNLEAKKRKRKVEDSDEDEGAEEVMDIAELE